MRTFRLDTHQSRPTPSSFSRSFSGLEQSTVILSSMRAVMLPLNGWHDHVSSIRYSLHTPGSKCQQMLNASFCFAKYSCCDVSLPFMNLPGLYARLVRSACWLRFSVFKCLCYLACIFMCQGCALPEYPGEKPSAGDCSSCILTEM